MLTELALFAAASLSGEFVDYKWRNDVSTGWERFTVAFTNESQTPQTLELCPQDAQMIVKTPGDPRRGSFAIAFEDKGWSFNCTTRELRAGESVDVSFYFRTSGLWGRQRAIELATNLGGFTIEGNLRAPVIEPVMQPVRDLAAR